MIAIPVEYNPNYELIPSKLFGNARLFALYTPQHEFLELIENKKSGNGIATAQYLLDHSVKEALYSFLGDGPFGALVKGGCKIFSMGKEPRSLEAVIHAHKAQTLTEVTYENSKELLDPGNAVGACECGCTT